MPGDRWETFARENPEYYICTGGAYTAPAIRDEFFASGRADVDRILDEVKPHLHHRRQALELGCGVGRLAIPMAAHFDQVTAVDVAPTMLARLIENCDELGATNVAASLADDPWDAQGPVDLAYSYLVFQHVESWDIIGSYVQRIASCLAKDGVGYLHFDSRPRTLAYRLRRFVPDPLLPRAWRRGIRRVRRPASRLSALVRDCGLAIRDERNPKTGHHIIVVAPAL